ncbi:MAG: hypothetical protein K2Q32_03325 [Alphaproteobacteria bacterium]|nr:hypothetical protein [Alphaproteobacteria bacterium]
MKCLFLATLFCASYSLAGFCATSAAPKAAVATTQAPALDLSIKYYSRVLTKEGVLRESRYTEKMLRRPGHVWVSRVLPKLAVNDEEQEGHEHKHFNYVLLPRHVAYDGSDVHVEFVDFHDKAVVNIAPSEYENINFDGSWASAFFLIDPQNVVALPPLPQASPVADARWYGDEKSGIFQRVLWDEKKMIPLIAETGDRAGTFFRRMEVKSQADLVKHLPWEKLQGYAQKEYADFLD